MDNVPIVEKTTEDCAREVIRLWDQSGKWPDSPDELLLLDKAIEELRKSLEQL